jgi:DNA adenine methylase
MFKQLRLSLPEANDSIQTAARYFAANRSSFSGTTCSGGMSPGHPRFNARSIERVRKFRNYKISVNKADFRESISSHRETFLFLDPPYYVESKLYGKMGDMHENFNHEELYALIKDRYSWVLCYNDCDKIRKLYAKYKIIPLEWAYGMTRRRSSEIVILSEKVSA